MTVLARSLVAFFASRRARRVAAVVSVVLGVSSASSVVGAQGGADDPSQAGAPPLSTVLPDDRLTASLAGLDVESAELTRAVANWSSAQRELAEAQRVAAENRSLIASLEAERVAARATVDEQRVLRRGAVFDLEGLDLAMSQLAVSSYVRGGPTADAAKMFDVGDVTDELYAQALERDVAADQVRRRGALQGEIARLQGSLDELTARLADLAGRVVEATAVVEERTRRSGELTERLPALESAVRDARLAAMVVGTDLPLVALDAYVRAAARLGAEKPQCALRWTMIAALGRIESRHGHINGATLRADGRATVRIVGIALTGENGTALVPDSDDGRLDGDAELDRAVGPMQFIPTTWAIYRRDGNGDGTADPQNIYDAALATAAFLCASGRTLSDNADLRAAYLAYNRSSTYVTTAVSNIERYDRLQIPPPARAAG